MSMKYKCLFALVIAGLPTRPGLAQGRLQFASIGDLRLTSGETILDCRIGYRTFGRLNANHSNIVVMTTWFTGTTGDLAELVGPGKLVDSSEYYVIAIDALGNGVSSSPSNSTRQPRMSFPRFIIADMVNSQHQLLTRVLHIDHVKAVIGSSMGGMQAFEWEVSYPSFMHSVVAIGASPRLAAYDLLLWQTQRDAITSDPAWNNGDYSAQPGTRLVGEIANLIDVSPEVFNELYVRDSVPSVISATARAIAEFDANNHIRQSEAMTEHDVSTQFGRSLARAAAVVKARTLIIVSTTERVVTPGPALAFAKMIGAQTLELTNKCGLALSNCERDRVYATVAEFLRR